MASIKGLSIKKVVEFKGHEGEPLFQCDVYYKGKKVGYFSQDSWGGQENVEVPKEVELAFADYPYVGRDGETHPSMVGIEWAIYDVYELLNAEKMFKKNMKKGFDLTIYFIVNGWQQYSVGLRAGAMVAMSTSTIIERTRQMYKECKGLPDSAFKVYRTLSDFEQGV